MNSNTQRFSCAIIMSALMTGAILEFAYCLTAQFSQAVAVSSDPVLKPENNMPFFSFVYTELKPIPTQYQNKNVLKVNVGVTGNIFFWVPLDIVTYHRFKCFIVYHT